MRQGIYKQLSNIRLSEDNGKNACLLSVTKKWAAIYYMLIIYTKVTDPYAEVLTWEEYKELYEYDEIKECFRCDGINLDKLASYFSFEDIIANNGVDTQLLIDAVVDETEVTCC